MIAKRDAIEMVDVNEENNLGKHRIYDNCPYAGYRKIVQDRIYPCCVIFGQATRRDIDLGEISVPFDDNWRENLRKIDIEEHCRHCFVDVDAPKVRVDSAMQASSPRRQASSNSACDLRVGENPRPPRPSRRNMLAPLDLPVTGTLIYAL